MIAQLVDHGRKPIKVLLLLHEMSLTGAPMSVLNALEFLGGNVEVRTLAPRAGPLLERCCALGSTTLIAPMLDAHNILGRLRRKLRVSELEASTRAWEPDVIYINSIAALKLTRTVNLPVSPPVLIHVHELQIAARYLLGGDSTQFCTLPARYVAVSGAVEHMLINSYGIGADRIVRIPEVISTKFACDPGDNGHVAGHPFAVGGAGALSERKGVLLWLQSAAELVRLVGAEAVRFQWVGAADTLEGQYYRGIASKLGLDGIVEFIPVIDDPVSYFKRFDVLAMTSWEDPCPLVVFENMALGVPVICFAGSGGAPEQVGDSGIIIDDFSPIKMAHALAGLVRDAGRRYALGAAAAKRFREHYAAAVVCPILLDELIKLCRDT